MAAIALAACGDGDDTLADPSNTDNGDRAPTRNAQVSINTAVSNACMSPDFDATEDEAFILLDASHYPSVIKKLDKMEDQRYAIPEGDLKALAKALEDAQGMGGLAVGAGLGSSLIPNFNIICNYELYEEAECATSELLAAGIFELTDVSKSNDRLMFSTRNPSTGATATITYENPDFNRYAISTVDADGITMDAQWNRTEGGTETYESTSSDGRIGRYTENPDCSGTFYSSGKDRRGKIQVHDYSWTSTLIDDFTVNFEICIERGAGEMVCKSGVI